MTILGIGVDITENLRFKKILKNKKLLSRIFSKNEILLSQKFKNKSSFFAKKFASKEAFAKSLGTGFRYNLNFKDIVIINDKLGKPKFKISQKIKDLIYKKFKLKSYNFLLSISDEKNYSIAFVIFQKK